MFSVLRRAVTILTMIAFSGALVSVAEAADYANCNHKRTLHRQIVLENVISWYDGDVDPGRLVDLVQIELGIGTCVLGKKEYPRLHTPTFPRQVDPKNFPALMLANELAWKGLLPEPTDGLVGEVFLVSPESLRGGVR